MSFLFKDIIFIPLIAICTGLFVYKFADPFLEFLAKRSLGKKDEVLRYLKLMSGKVDEKRVVLMMLLMSFGFGFMFFIVLWPNVTMGLLIGGVVTIVGWSLPPLLVKILYEKRCDVFVDQLVDGLTIMSNGIKSQTNVAQTMERVIEIMGNPLRAEFEQLLTQHKLGQSFEEALLDLGNRIPRPDVQMLVTSINILKETGGDLSQTFDSIVFTIRERQKLEKKIQALTAMGRFQGLVVTLIPFILALVFFIADPAMMMPMFTTTLGLFLIFIMITLQVIGGFLIRKIVTIKV
jgi:tight adherence protein B